MSEHLSNAVYNQLRPILSDQELESLSKEEIIAKWKQLDKYTTGLEEKTSTALLETAKLKNIILMNYVCSKELESSETSSTTTTTAAASNPASTLTGTDNVQINKQSFFNPAINSIIIQLKKELEETRKKKEELQLELDATKFTPESQLTKRLMAKCRKLLSENEELGKIISSGNVAQLEHDLAYHKQLLNEACENEQNINSFLFEIDNEMENMQAILIKLKEEKKAQEESSQKEDGDEEKKSKKKRTK